MVQVGCWGDAGCCDERVRDGRDVRGVDDWNVDGRKYVENGMQVLSTVWLFDEDVGRNGPK